MEYLENQPVVKLVRLMEEVKAMERDKEIALSKARNGKRGV